MGILTIREHSSPYYSPRTWANAKEADVTIALAVDYTTAGEKLTHKAAGDRYLKLDVFNTSVLHCARLLWKRLQATDGKCVNVAGNGIYTLSKHGWRQDLVNNSLFEILDLVHTHHGIDRITSGGQTGVDIAGAYAGWKLGIDTVVTLPKGFIQRHEDGVDKQHTMEEIRRQITGG